MGRFAAPTVDNQEHSRPNSPLGRPRGISNSAPPSFASSHASRESQSSKGNHFPPRDPSPEDEKAVPSTAELPKTELPKRALSRESSNIRAGWSANDPRQNERIRFPTSRHWGTIRSDITRRVSTLCYCPAAPVCATSYCIKPGNAITC